MRGLRKEGSGGGDVIAQGVEGAWGWGSWAVTFSYGARGLMCGECGFMVRGLSPACARAAFT